MRTIEILGEKAEYYLSHVCRTIDKSQLYLPAPDTVDKVWMESDRNIRTLGSLQWILAHGRLAGTGYVSILPVDQGIEHSAGASFAPNPAYFDPENIVRLAIEGGCNAVASTFGVLGAVARRYAHKIPFIVKLNHNELLTYPNTYDQVMFGTVRDAWNMGAAAVGATIYFGSEESRRQLVEIAGAFDYADVANALCDKLVYRHPHVYGDIHANTPDQVKENWEALKLRKKNRKSGTLGGVPRSLPALVKAFRVGEKAAATGFDWQKREDVWDKVKEETAEVEAEMRSGDKANLEAEFGDLFFALVNAARLYGVDPESALERTNKKFIRRFNYMEEQAAAQGNSLHDLSLGEMEALWQEAKKGE